MNTTVKNRIAAIIDNNWNTRQTNKALAALICSTLGAYDHIPGPFGLKENYKAEADRHASRIGERGSKLGRIDIRNIIECAIARAEHIDRATKEVSS